MEREIKTKIRDIDCNVNVYDTNQTPLSELLQKEIRWARVWNDYYLFILKTDDRYDNTVYMVNKNTKKVEWGYYTSLGFVAEENGTSISPEELKRALA